MVRDFGATARILQKDGMSSQLCLCYTFLLVDRIDQTKDHPAGTKASSERTNNRRQNVKIVTASAPLITLEEHFVSADLLPALSDIYAEQLKHILDVAARLIDLGPLRLADMDANRISLQVVSHALGLGTRPPRLSTWQMMSELQ